MLTWIICFLLALMLSALKLLLHAAKVLFIFRCSKNWQKKSAGNHLLSKFLLPIFTAVKDEKYFSGKMLTQKIVRSREQKLKKNPIKLKPCILKDVNKCLRSKKRKPVDVFQRQC